MPNVVRDIDEHGCEEVLVSCRYCNDTMVLVCWDEGDLCTYWCPNCGAKFESDAGTEEEYWESQSSWKRPRTSK